MRNLERGMKLSFHKVGNFFEIYGKGAEYLARTLNLTTTRGPFATPVCKIHKDAWVSKKHKLIEMGNIVEVTQGEG